MSLWTHHYSLDEIATAALMFLKEFSAERVFCFSGDLGAGKTTFIAALVKELHSNDQVHSPTFSLVNQYLTKDGQTLFHFDFYRLKSDEEAFESGLMELIDAENLCFIEWPERARSILPNGYVEVNIEVEGTVRKLMAQKIKQ
jgi:tRNA threonylcarbamoyladenosine biosynthesis protein TsaE